MEESILKARAEDAIRLSHKGPRFIGFLDPSETAFLQAYLKYQRDASFRFWGGYQDAQRCMLGVFQPWDDEPCFPIEAISLYFRDEDQLSHRDFLGSLMAQGVARASLGDILVETGRAVIFVKTELQDYFLNNISKVGRTGVRCSPGAQQPLPAANSFQELSSVVASERADCIVAFLMKTSREKAVLAINGGLVALNYAELSSVSARVAQGDIISIRHTGKFVIDSLGPPTKKGRLVIKCRKYI